MQTDGHQLNGHPHRPCGGEGRGGERRGERRGEGEREGGRGRESMDVAYRMTLHSYDTPMTIRMYSSMVSNVWYRNGTLILNDSASFPGLVLRQPGNEIKNDLPTLKL